MSHFKQYYTNIYYECIFVCPPGDFDCLGVCARVYNENRNTCPCQSGCPNGCPCPDYQCPSIESTTTGVTTITTLATTTTTSPSTTTPVLPRNSVLILNTNRSNKAVITDGSGKEEHVGVDFRFIFGENTEVYGSCSITWRGELFIFGGRIDEYRQISKLNDCTLERVGTLSFDHRYGTCAVVNDEEIYLCFDDYSPKTCRKANDPMGAFSEVNPTNYEHSVTRIGASSGKYSSFEFNQSKIPHLDALLAIGDYYYDKKVEMLELNGSEAAQWRMLGDYPFVKVFTYF